MSNDSFVHEIIPAVKTILDVNDLNNFPTGDMQIGNNILISRTGEIYFTSTEAPWIRVIIMPEKRPDPRPDHLDKTQGYRFKIRTDVCPPNNDPESFDTGVTHELAQEKIFSLLKNVKPALTESRVLSPFWRVARPGEPIKDLKSNYDSTASTWILWITKL